MHASRLRPWLFATSLGLAGCAVFRSGDDAGPGGFRRYYLTKTTVPGNQAMRACERGFHMASRFEILDVTRLEYDTGLGFTTDDSGFGPPSQAAQPSPPGGIGWIRTGGAARYTDTREAADAADTNCAAWSTSSAQASGTVASLSDRFVPSRDPNAVWTGGAQSCDRPFRVWCVEDAEVPEPRFFPRMRRRSHAVGD